MTTTTALILVAACALVTYTARAGLIIALADRTLPAVVERALANVGPAVLAALTINLALGTEGVRGVEFAEVAALAVAAVVTIWRSSLIATFVAGMVTLWVLGALT
jgi:branched-subunit amino acid transport protein